jgi:phosphatidate cytidylyltransferase
LQAYLVLQTLEYGMAWYIFAMSIITLNDIAAYMCGFFFGSRPLILLSPKKTLEGYIGENICFMVFFLSTVVTSTITSHYVCHQKGLKQNSFSLYYAKSKNSLPFVIGFMIIFVLSEILRTRKLSCYCVF